MGNSNNKGLLSVGSRLAAVLSIMLLLNISLPQSNAAIIKGTVYDAELRPMKDVLIEINTTPMQRYVAKDGTYLFSLPLGYYNITAHFESQNQFYFASESIRLDEDGRYLRDLFMKTREKYAQEPAPLPEQKSFYETYILYFMYGGGTLIGLAIVGLSYWLLSRGKKDDQKLGERKEASKAAPIKDEDYDLESLIAIIRKNGGRMTQKDIRKAIPLSEAKISLMISELEEQHKVKKIRKGRGNIIILK